MESRLSLKQDVKKLKKLAHHVEGWTLKAREFIHQTQVICGSNLICGASQEYDEMLLESVQIMSAAVNDVTELTNLKSTEVTKEGHKKGVFSRHFKDSSLNRANIHNLVEDAIQEITLAVLDTLHVQARQFERIAEHSSSAIDMAPLNKTGRVTAPLTPTGRGACVPTIDGWGDVETNICRSTPAGGDIHDLDWDAFEKDLMVMTTAVGGNAKFPPLPGYDDGYYREEIEALLATQKEIEMERDQALVRAQEVEDSLLDLKRQHEVLVDDMHHQYTLDDVEALQVALKQEQVARALAESDLHIARMQARAAEDDAEANHLALTVVQQVAAQMATDSGGTRRWSTGGPLSQAYNPSTVSGNDTVPVSPTDQVVDAGEPIEASPMVTVPLGDSMRTTRTDSAFMVREEDEHPIDFPPTSPENNDSSSLADYSTDQVSSPLLTPSEPREEQRILERVSLPLPETLPLVDPNKIHKRLSTSSRNAPSWNPFNGSSVDKPEESEEPIVGSATCESGSSGLQGKPVEESWNPFGATPSTSSNMTFTEKPSEEWNPFSESAPGDAVPKIKDISAEHSASNPVQEAWNPFGSVPQESPKQTDEKAWNPFNGVPVEQPAEPWNPFMNVPEHKPENQESTWNPFGPCES